MTKSNTALAAGRPPEDDQLLDVAVSLTLQEVDCGDGAAVAEAIERARATVPAHHFDEFAARARMKAMKDEGNGLRTVKLEPEAFDFDADPPEPEWIVTGLLERATVNVCSGDTGSAKSIHWQDATVRLAHGEDWLDRKVPERARVLYVDEENPRRIPHTRLRALGMTNDDRERVRYFRRKGIQLGDAAGKWVRWAEEECEEFGPDLFVIDTAMAATETDVNDNDAVAGLYTKVLRPLAERFDLAVVILHHERKPMAGEKRNAGYAMMGARQWAGQADVHMTLTASSEYTETPRDAGGVDTHKAFEFAVAKGRDGAYSRPERTVVRGVKEPRVPGGPWVLTSMSVDWEGRIEADTAEDDSFERMLRHLSREPEAKWTRQRVAEALGQAKPKQPDGTFKRAWKRLDDEGLTEPDGQGVRLTEKGREAATVLPLDY